MPMTARNGVKLYFEETGTGMPILFLHEFAGDHRSWEQQVRHFTRDHRCIVTAGRGYPPSDVPANESDYGQDIAIADAVAVLDHLKIERAVVIGLSMGAYTALRIAMEHPKRVIAAVAASGGSGSWTIQQATFSGEAKKLSARILKEGKIPADDFANGPTRTQLRRKDPRGWAEFRDLMAGRPAMGAAMTLARVQAERPSLMGFEAEFKACKVPTLLMVGDEDEACIDINVWLKRIMPAAGLVMFPKCGHLMNLEEPGRFNAEIAEFLRAVHGGAWPFREAATGTFGGVGPAEKP
ncbi:MAG: alpha/beta hydrolase [Proteobacteria bacterium]|nr:alpha/beta hydrolase [Pseudomonadota bacterium]